VGRLLRSRRVGAGFSRSELGGAGYPGHRQLERATPPLGGQQPQTCIHHQAYNTTTAHKKTPNPPTKNNLSSPEPRLGFQQTDTHSHTHFYGPLPSQHARELTFKPSFFGLCYLHTEKKYVEEERVALIAAAPRTPLASRQPCLRSAAAGGGELPAIYRAIDWW